MREPDVLPKGGTSWEQRWGLHEPLDRPRPRRPKRPLAAALLSCLLPGAGQLYLGQRSRGSAMLAVTAVCLAAAVGIWSDPGALSRMLVQPNALVALLVADVGLLVFRMVAVVDAYLLAARQRPPPARGRWRRLGVAGLVGVIGLTGIPHLASAYYDLQAYDLITSVFTGADPGWKAGGRGGAANGVATALPGRITVLLIGGDAGPDRQGLRTDSMIVASADLTTGRTALFGLPRNLVQAPMPEGPAADLFGCSCFPRPLNELYAFAELERPDLFPGGRHPGVVALAGVAEALLGIPIDHYALVDLKGFVDMVNALGGVTVNVTKPILIEVDRLGTGGAHPRYELQPGRRHLDGWKALAYARSRKTTSDYDRMQRQRCLLGSLARQTDPAELLRTFPRLVGVIKRNVVTDIPAGQLPALIEAAGARRAQVSTLGFAPPTYTVGWSAGYPIPDVPLIQQTVRRMLRLPGATVAKPSGGNGVTATTGAASAGTGKAPAKRESCTAAG